MTISRRNLLALSVLAAALVTYTFWPGTRWRYQNLPPRATGPWVAFGDSLTEGYGANGGMDYPAQLSKRLGIPIRNLGVAGDTSADGLKRLAEVEALEPSVVLLCFGGNDVLQNVPRKQMLANIATMIDRFQARGSFVVLIGIRSAALVGDANAKEFKELARSKQVMHVSNILDGLLTQPSLMSDYVHPNDAGYTQIAERLAKELRPLVSKLQVRREEKKNAAL